MSVQAKEDVIIVIDPGHGGENLGAEYGSYTEKDMTMVVAKAMKEELEKYENVEVYLTHEEDVDMSLADRVTFARDKNADFLFCLHFNMSVNHDYFGSEVWVSAFDRYYATEYAFAKIQMQEFTDIGLFSRGIKTKLNDKGTDYYGILRHGTEEGISVALIEHCHLDSDVDQPFYTQGENQLIAFGKMDATAAAKYFKLSSEELGISYNDYPVAEIEIPDQVVRPDDTAAALCELTLAMVNEENGEITLSLKAEDTDSYLLYYNYSLNGGNTYSHLQPWEQAKQEITFTVTVPSGEAVELRASVYNSFDVVTESNIIALDAIPYAKESETIAATTNQEVQEVISYEPQNTEHQTINYITIGILLLCLLFIVILSFQMARKLTGKEKHPRAQSVKAARRRRRKHR